MKRARKPSANLQKVAVEHREITDSSRELLHQRRTFAQRERQRLAPTREAGAAADPCRRWRREDVDRPRLQPRDRNSHG
jgi:hypothetical protein